MDTPDRAALEAAQLRRRYGRRWALRDCSFTLPAGRVAALVGPNGAGKTTLLHLAVGLLAPSGGDVRVFGDAPRERPRSVLPRIGFVAQDHPLYRGMTVEEHVILGRKLNPRWDGDLAARRLRRLGIPPEQRAGSLSGGQQAQVALALALAKRPELVLLDEPLASLDPLARREFLRALTLAVEEQGLTVVLSSHIVGDLERVCNYLIILSASQVRIAGEIADLLPEHAVFNGPSDGVAALDATHAVIDTMEGGPRTELLARGRGPAPAGWKSRPATLEEIVLAYLSQPEAARDALVEAGAQATSV
jgi:ABC-2 type transport system ATP-binding protein